MPENPLSGSSPWRADQGLEPRQKPSFSPESLIKKIALVIGVGIILAVGAGYYFYSRPQAPRISIDVSAPTDVKAGEPFEAKFTISNNSDIVIENAKLSIILPEGINFAGLSEDQRVREENVGDIGPGSITDEHANILIVGDTGVREFEAVLSYRTPGSGATFETKTKARVNVTGTAVKLEIVAPQKVFSGENFELVVNFENQSERDIQKLELKIDYPAVFRFERTSLDPVRGNNVWELGPLVKGERGSFTITGTAVAPEESFFGFTGTLTATFLGQEYKLLSQSTNVAVALSPLSVSIKLGDGGTNVAEIGDTLNYLLTYRNNSDVTMENVNLRATLTGELFDFSSLNTNGSFNSISNTLSWNAASMPELRALTPGQEGSVSFHVMLKKEFPIRRVSDKNYLLKVQAQIESPTVPPLTAAVKTMALSYLETKVAGMAGVNALAFYKDAATTNTGPYPPQVNKPTSYTIHWQIKNYATDIKDVRVKAFLKSGAKVIGQPKSTTDAAPAYNAASGEVSWSIPYLQATRGVLGAVVEAVFQVEATPAVNQVGQSLELMNETSLTATDVFTNQDLTDKDGVITTDLPDDNNVGFGDRRVQP